MSRLRELPSYQRLPLDPVAACGDFLVLEDGEELLDLYGGHCVNSLGAGDSELGRELSEQWQELSFATNILPLRVRERFEAALAAGLPDGGWRYFLANSGAEANENALKAALAATGRAVVVCFEGAFHGRTAAASAVTDTHERGFPRVPFVLRRVPWGDLEALGRAMDSDVACVMTEPIQSLAGVVDPPSGFLEGLRAACDRHGAWLVFDEVQTGNGRLGTPWAAQHFGVLPDAITTAKGIGGGFPVGLTLIAERNASDVPAKLFGSTFGGSPLALLAASIVWERVMAPGFLENVRAASATFCAAANRGPIQRVRGAGLLLGLEVEAGLAARDVRYALLARGVFVGTSNDPRVLRLSPALTIRPALAERLALALESLEIHA
jgi:acetylornithine/succinyldiaminopimelate/putrescine aminotransferase